MAGNIFSALKPPFLVKFTIIRHIGLGDHCQDITLLDDHGAVVELPSGPQGHPQGGEHLQVPGGLQDGAQSLDRAVQEGVLQKQVAAGVAGEAQLRQGQDLDPLLLRFPHHSEDLFCVVPAVRHPDLGRSRRHTDKTVFHIEASSFAFIAPIVPPKAKKSNRARYRALLLFADRGILTGLSLSRPPAPGLPARTAVVRLVFRTAGLLAGGPVGGGLFLRGSV